MKQRTHVLVSQRWLVILIIILYAAGVFFDRFFICSHLSAGLNLDANECQTRFY